MQVKIIDKELLNSIKPERLKRYLEENGWEDREAMGEARVFHKGETGILWLPNNRFADYSQRMREVVDTLAQIQDISQLEVITKLVGINLGNKYKLVREIGNLRISLVAMN